MSRKALQIGLIIYAIAMLVVSTIPGGNIPKIDIWSFDKILHIIEYAILAFFAINIIQTPTKLSIFMIILIGTLYGGLNEIWQGLVAGRSASIYDAAANLLGMIIGSILTLKYLIIARDK